jgi:hypothetical protein
LAAGADQVKNAVENLPQVRGRPAHALRLGQELLQECELLVAESLCEKWVKPLKIQDLTALLAQALRSVS